MKWLVVGAVILCSATPVTAGDLKVYSNRDLEKYSDGTSESDRSGSAMGSAVSVDVQKADLIAVLKLIADSAMKDGVKMYIDPQIKGKTTIKSVHAPWGKVLFEIAGEHNLEVKVDRDLKEIHVVRALSVEGKDSADSSLEKYPGDLASSRGRRAARLTCESGHWIESVSGDGGIIKVEDGSLWEVDPVDSLDSALWLPLSGVVICDDRIINVDDNETVSAARIR